MDSHRPMSNCLTLLMSDGGPLSSQFLTPVCEQPTRRACLCEQEGACSLAAESMSRHCVRYMVFSGTLLRDCYSGSGRHDKLYR